MTNKELLDEMFGEHDSFRYIQKLRGTVGCVDCFLRKFCDEYNRNRNFTSCGQISNVFLNTESGYAKTN